MSRALVVLFLCCALSWMLVPVMGLAQQPAPADHPSPAATAAPADPVAEPAAGAGVKPSTDPDGAPDPENCLSCHRFRGLSRLDAETGELRLFFCSAEYYARQEGPHARLRCTACHAEAEFEKIPHEPKTAVDCTRTCHLASSSGLAREFSHQPVAEILASSVHRPEHLAKLRWDVPYLRPGQSECLWCHDEPTFRVPEIAGRSHRGFDASARCDTCHGEELPVQVDYAMKHAASRLQPARPVRQLVQVCAVCHSDAAVLEQMESHDTVSSYLHSFHGKASLLGSLETATCVDCHAHESGNVHLMQGSAEVGSSTHPDRVGDTCRSSDCHAGSPPGIGTAGVHLPIDSSSRTPEFWVAAFFILLTVGVMTLYFLLVLLELLSAAFRPSSAEHHRLVHLARRLLADPRGRAALARLSLHQRVQHWGLAIFFLLLVLTGMPVKFADEPWASSIVALVGGLTAARTLHRVAGAALALLFFYHLVYTAVLAFPAVVAALRRRTWRALFDLVFAHPMMFTWRDVREFAELFAYLLFLRRERPRHPHFHFSEKFEYMAVFWGMAIIGFSGAALWVGPMIAEFVPGWVLNFAFIVHSDEAYLAFIYIAVVHFFSVMLAPSVFPLSLGTVSGDAPAIELAEGHAGALLEVAERLGIGVDEPAAGHGGLRSLLGSAARRAYSLALFAVVAVIGFTSLSFLARLLLTRPTAPVEIRASPPGWTPTP